jgi:hypothetical protein
MSTYREWREARAERLGGWAEKREEKAGHSKILEGLLRDV